MVSKSIPVSQLANAPTIDFGTNKLHSYSQVATPTIVFCLYGLHWYPRVASSKYFAHNINFIRILRSQLPQLFSAYMVSIGTPASQVPDISPTTQSSFVFPSRNSHNCFFHIWSPLVPLRCRFQIFRPQLISACMGFISIPGSQFYILIPNMVCMISKTLFACKLQYFSTESFKAEIVAAAS